MEKRSLFVFTSVVLFQIKLLDVVRLISQFVWNLIFSIRISGDYGKGPKCGTTYHTVYSTVEDTFFEKSCSKVSDRQCKTVFDTSYEGEIETQCKPEYVSKCKHVYKTGYKKYCTTVHDEECRISYATSFKTVYDKKCSTHYEKSCHDVGYGYHKEGYWQTAFL